MLGLPPSAFLPLACAFADTCWSLSVYQHIFSSFLSPKKSRVNDTISMTYEAAVSFNFWSLGLSPRLFTPRLLALSFDKSAYSSDKKWQPAAHSLFPSLLYIAASSSFRTLTRALTPVRRKLHLSASLPASTVFDCVLPCRLSATPYNYFSYIMQPPCWTSRNTHFDIKITKKVKQ